MNENLSSLYERLGRVVFDSLRERDESVPAEQFFDELMFSAMSLCVEITDCIKEEEAEKPAVADIPVTRMMAFTEDEEEYEPEEEKPQAPILFCTNCGARLEDDSCFCTKCGHKVEV